MIKLMPLIRQQYMHTSKLSPNKLAQIGSQVLVDAWRGSLSYHLEVRFGRLQLLSSLKVPIKDCAMHNIYEPFIMEGQMWDSV